MRFTTEEEALNWQHYVTGLVGDIIKDRMKKAGISVNQMSEDLCSNWSCAASTARGVLSDYRGGYAWDRISEERDRTRKK